MVSDELAVILGKGANMERDWAIIKYCLLVVFLSYVIIYAVEAV